MTDNRLDFAKQDGLIPVIVTDFKTGQVLMLAYMNEDSYQLTLETKQMHYWSRTRQEIWHKGATSGHYQYVQSIKADCDRDTLLAAVRQEGAACHTGAYSCFFREIYPGFGKEK
ncbi:phosphoribosyl-AMP cyclohydrolase [Streptococcus chenjunshii]|uniref:Phosphoribosyl-AMP cyclohydrolase n=1 Tax=Streptococcus chenjunshii TaxID=2173853 RepID=A0A372KNP9_9STRE|nr:phosphoribosyl-AMP cyclohydrolase [Streptococcus chenjunshii]AXQ78969.1 phosphoribosyl-AMP cyclohydrolase [Streptococcus chenjunshii]RFU51396.1 phosphoribosyl-AMP cyclohydrolase [Streptococcus chenjunshii]RFU53596.1 phosphoribosyl-AMP cyclohydrolase [Streptococcus chenjunshii]